MALDSLVDSTQLNSDLTDVADAIRAKTGGSSPLAFPNEFISEIGSISGGGSVKVEGTFTLNTDSIPPVITHNLNTEKIAVIVYPISTVVAHSGYKEYSLCYINFFAFTSGQTWHLDYTQYNSGHFPNVLDIDIDNYTDYPRIANGNASPWTTQSDFRDGAFYGDTRGQYTITANTFKINNTFCSGTYKYIIWSLE